MKRAILALALALPSTILAADPTPLARGHPPRFEIDVSYVANLVHWIDNLAGSSQGKTIAAYRRYWRQRYGMPDAGEMDLLRSWVAIRAKPVPTPEPAILNERGCLPQPGDVIDWRRTFQTRSYEAADVDDFISSLSAELSAQESATLRRVIEKFRGRFDAAWKETGYLPRFESKLKPFLAESGLAGYLGEVASFFGVDPDAAPPGRIELMALPEEGPTHAQADGRYLLIEIRPGDEPRDQIQVIAHETSHYLWHQLDPGRNDALARRVFASGASPAMEWRLLREALPTALGQGLADARFSPATFRETGAWYHVADVDALAKAIFPAVRDAFRDGRRLEEKTIDEIARLGGAAPPIAAARPVDLVGDGFAAAGAGMGEALARLRRDGPLRFSRLLDPRDASDAAFASRYECLGGVVLLGPGDLLAPGRVAPPFAAEDPVGAPAAAAPVSRILATRRSGGGVVFQLVAARAEDADRLVTAFLGLQTIPAGPVPLEPPRPP
ncbi:MAG TPA: hypothetical protein VE404_06880 [Verrucomicrobiae bacterium]|nr:hypothetical protein [Verrucomicrobiae bacterium]